MPAPLRGQGENNGEKSRVQVNCASETRTSGGSSAGSRRKMWQLRFWVCLLLIALSLAPVRRVAGCSCTMSHPQSVFCSADFIALVRVKKESNVDGFEIGYSVKVNKIFKVTSKESYAALKSNILWTPGMDSMCGITLEVGETYVVSGRAFNDSKAYISLCDLALVWRNVTSRQRKGFKHLYAYGCSCGIRYTPWWTKGATLEHTDGRVCLWESKPGPEDCQKDVGVCMPRPGGCSWVPSVPYKNCIKEYKQMREQQRAWEP